MRRYNAIIVDDEINLQRTLEILISQNCPEINIIGKAISAEAGRELLKNNQVDVIFLDISMPGENGFDFVASIQKEQYAIIFVTAYEEYALKAIKANAIDYLLKPVNPEELSNAVKKVVFSLKLRNSKKELQAVYSESLNNFILQMQKNDEAISRITVDEKFGFRVVELDAIRFIEADGNYTIFHLSNLEKIVSSKSLGEYGKIVDSDKFFRIHRSTIINLDYLKGFSSYQGNYVILDNDTKLTISRRRYSEFREVVSTRAKSVDS